MPVKRAEVEKRERLGRWNESLLAHLSDVLGTVTAGFGLADVVSYSGGHLAQKPRLYGLRPGNRRLPDVVNSRSVCCEERTAIELFA
jgi:hypothetical protein